MTPFIRLWTNTMPVFPFYPISVPITIFALLISYCAFVNSFFGTWYKSSETLTWNSFSFASTCNSLPSFLPLYISFNFLCPIVDESLRYSLIRFEQYYATNIFGICFNFVFVKTQIWCLMFDDEDLMFRPLHFMITHILLFVYIVISKTSKFCFLNSKIVEFFLLAPRFLRIFAFPLITRLFARHPNLTSQSKQIVKPPMIYNLLFVNHPHCYIQCVEKVRFTYISRFVNIFVTDNERRLKASDSHSGWWNS